MDELAQTGEWGRELTAEEWEQIERDVDMGYLSYDDARRKWGTESARRKLGTESPSYQIVHAVDEQLSNQNIPADEKPRPRRRCYFAAFDTRTGDAMLAYASKQEPSDKERGRN